MQTKDQPGTANSLTTPAQRFSGLGAHTAAPPRAATPPVTGSLTNRGRGAR